MAGCVKCCLPLCQAHNTYLLLLPTALLLARFCACLLHCRSRRAMQPAHAAVGHIADGCTACATDRIGTAFVANYKSCLCCSLLLVCLRIPPPLRDAFHWLMRPCSCCCQFARVQLPRNAFLPMPIAARGRENSTWAPVCCCQVRWQQRWLAVVPCATVCGVSCLLCTRVACLLWLLQPVAVQPSPHWRHCAFVRHSTCRLRPCACTRGAEVSSLPFFFFPQAHGAAAWGAPTVTALPASVAKLLHCSAALHALARQQEVVGAVLRRVCGRLLTRCMGSMKQCTPLAARCS